MAGNAQHGVEDARVGDAAGAELGVDHVLAGCGGVSHWIPGFRLPELKQLRLRNQLPAGPGAEERKPVAAFTSCGGGFARRS